MRVSTMEFTVLENLVVVTVVTDEGLEGHGYAQKGRSVAEALASVVRPQVLGEDPFDRIDAEGNVHVPEAPGLGVELDWDVLDKHTVGKL